MHVTRLDTSRGSVSHSTHVYFENDMSVRGESSVFGFANGMWGHDMSLSTRPYDDGLSPTPSPRPTRLYDVPFYLTLSRAAAAIALPDSYLINCFASISLYFYGTLYIFYPPYSEALAAACRKVSEISTKSAFAVFPCFETTTDWSSFPFSFVFIAMLNSTI